MTGRDRAAREALAKLTREVTALREERQRLRKLALAWRAARAEATITGSGDVVKGHAAAMRAHAITEEIVAVIDAPQGGGR